MRYPHTAEYLLALRKSKGKTIHAIARNLGVHPQAVYNWENGKCFIPVKLIYKAATCLEMNQAEVDELLAHLAKDREVNFLKKIQSSGYKEPKVAVSKVKSLRPRGRPRKTKV